jgi:hypothetical protein
MPRKLALMSAFLGMEGSKNSRPPVKSRSRDEVRVASTFFSRSTSAPTHNFSVHLLMSWNVAYRIELYGGRVASRPEAAMSRKFLALNSITFLVTLSGAGADPTPLWINQGEELHSAVTDVTEVVDMSYADPKTWHSLPPAAQLDD